MTSLGSDEEGVALNSSSAQKNFSQKFNQGNARAAAGGHQTQS